MLNLNKVTIAGCLGTDPRVTDAGERGLFAQLSVATNEVWGSESHQQHTEWHTVVLKGQMATFANEYLLKGDVVYVEGRIRTRRYLNEEQVECFVKEIRATEIKLISKARANQQQPQQPQQQPQQRQPQQQQRQQQQRQQQSSQIHRPGYVTG